MTTAIQKRENGALASLAGKYNVQSADLIETLKNTVFKKATDAQMVALCVVADQYGLNPFTKEIYAFPDKSGGIIPVVGVDGWLRMINDHPAFDGMCVEGDASECTVTMHRKDRTYPTVITEYANECAGNSAPWKSHPARMLRHKAIIQAARVAFGFSVKDPDEAERIVEAQDIEVSEPVLMPREIVDEAQADTQSITGTIDDVKTSGARMGIVIGALTIGTGDAALGQKAAQSQGMEATATYTVKGKVLELVTLEVA